MASAFEWSFLAYAAGFFVSVAASIAIVRHFADEDQEKLPTFACVVGLTFSILTMFLIPIDIYSVNVDSASSSDITNWGDAIKILYYIMFSGIIAVSFMVIPFAYFYYEADDLNVSVATRCAEAGKYTLATLLIVTTLLICGLFVKTGERSGTNEQWINDLADQENQGDGAITFTVAIIAIIGNLGLITYTAYGLAALPLSLIRTRPGETTRSSDEMSDIVSEKNIVTERIRAIESKMLNPNYKLGMTEKKQLQALRREEELLTNKSRRNSTGGGGAEQRSWWERATRPVKVLAGLGLLSLSCVVATSLAITTVDKGQNSLCGASCGFVLDSPTLPNPIDDVLVYLPFPSDYIVIGIIILHLFACTLYGLSQIGIRILFIQLYSIRKKGTVAQGLLMATVVMVFGLTAIALNMTTLAPQYSTFGGSQVFTNSTTGEEVECSITETADTGASGHCHMTQLATFINQISVKTSFFAIVFFACNVLFVAFFIIYFLYLVFIRKNMDDLEINLDIPADDDSSDRRPLLKNNNYSNSKYTSSGIKSSTASKYSGSGGSRATASSSSTSSSSSSSSSSSFYSAPSGKKEKDDIWTLK